MAGWVLRPGSGLWSNWRRYALLGLLGREAKPVDAPRIGAIPAASSTGFAIQLGAFSKPGDASALRDKLRAAGFTAFTESVATDKGTLTRVRVGPVLGRAEAEQLKAQVKAKFGLDGIVRPHP